MQVGGIMNEDDEAARKAKAEKLRQKISRLTNQEDNTDRDSNEEIDSSQDVDLPHNSQDRSSPSMSPREFIHKRMQESDEGEN
jgi:hypothetical protein